METLAARKKIKNQQPNVQNEQHLSLFMELPARTDLIDTAVDYDPLLATSFTYNINPLDVNYSYADNDIKEEIIIDLDETELKNVDRQPNTEINKDREYENNKTKEQTENKIEINDKPDQTIPNENIATSHEKSESDVSNFSDKSVSCTSSDEVKKIVTEKKKMKKQDIKIRSLRIKLRTASSHGNRVSSSEESDDYLMSKEFKKYYRLYKEKKRLINNKKTKTQKIEQMKNKRKKNKRVNSDKISNSSELSSDSDEFVNYKKRHKRKRPRKKSSSDSDMPVKYFKNKSENIKPQKNEMTNAQKNVEKIKIESNETANNKNKEVTPELKIIGAQLKKESEDEITNDCFDNDNVEISVSDNNEASEDGQSTEATKPKKKSAWENDYAEYDQFFDEQTYEKKKKNIKKYNCNICKLVTSCKGAFKTHLLRKHNLIYVYGCVLCEMKFESMDLLMSHRKAKHFDTKSNSFSCIKCDRQFREFHKLLSHIKDQHDLDLDKNVEFCVDKNIKIANIPKSDNKTVIRAESETGTIVFKPEKTKADQNESTKKLQKAKKPYQISICHFCGKSFNFLGQFKEHLLKHENIKNYVCSVCQKAFISKRILTIHKKIHESIAERKYICGFVFDDSNNCASSKQNDDSNYNSGPSVEIPHTDNTQNESEFLDATKQLTNSKQLNCANKQLMNSTNLEQLNSAKTQQLNSAKTQQLNVENDKQLPNSTKKQTSTDPRITHNGAYIILDERDRRVCNFACVSKSDLNKHRLVHLNLKPFSCYLCNMKFRQSAHLRRHIKRHTGTKEYKCDVCKREFVTKDNLNNHLRTHSEVLPYICEVCGKTFLQRTQCMKHIRKCHPNYQKEDGAERNGSAHGGAHDGIKQTTLDAGNALNSESSVPERIKNNLTEISSSGIDLKCTKSVIPIHLINIQEISEATKLQIV